MTRYKYEKKFSLSTKHFPAFVNLPGRPKVVVFPSLTYGRAVLTIIARHAEFIFYS